MLFLNLMYYGIILKKNYFCSIENSKNTSKSLFMKKILVAIIFCLSSLNTSAQSGYEIKINLKNCKDSLVYLTYYQFDKTFIKDTCTHIKNGKIIFKGKGKLNKGIYTLISQDMG